MTTVWFVLLGFALSTYVVLDGFDLGAGLLHLFVAKTEPERRQVIRSIGPVWDGNEVWLLATGGTLFLAFPSVLATALSGFYLPIMIVLWLLLLRALGIELRHQVHDPLWTGFWDVVFCLSSLLLVVFFGAALGNVIRGVSFEKEGHFFAPLWTHFGLRDPVGVLDFYTVLIGVTALVVLAHHGATWLVWKTDGVVRERAERVASRLFFVVILAIAAATAASFVVQPRLLEGLSQRPFGFVFVLPALALLLVPVLRKRGQLGKAFLASCVHVYGLLGAAAVGLYPWLLPGTQPGVGLTVENAAASAYSLKVGLIWWLPGVAFVLLCHRFVYSHLPRVVSASDEDHH